MIPSRMTTPDSNRLWSAENGTKCAECGHSNPVSMERAGCGCCERAIALMDEKDACTDCIPVGTYPDGSGYPCIRHATI